MNANPKLTVTLTDRAPVTITKDKWPVIACASSHDGQVECQANRRWFLKVRRHADGRTVVYGKFESNWAKERDLRAGELLASDDDIPAAIKRVAISCDCETLADSCIADLPPVEIIE